ncbi:hypothetical protein CCACVL1_12040 [Corchorus capsularis]|uniref:AB hydrolase-1 domain-containing protein n=1 Tax=Corchorus capsularis TaxID=210143 RepID=A0A1R3IHX5_COCAP|nr:hypothetical protein CCACVL1_12040 [Corchorus capsularis]
MEAAVGKNGSYVMGFPLYPATTNAASDEQRRGFPSAPPLTANNTAAPPLCNRHRSSPEFGLTSVSVSKFNISEGSEITAEWEVGFLVRNPNPVWLHWFDHPVVSVYYRDQLVSELGSFPQVKIPRNTTKSYVGKTVAVGKRIEDREVAEAMARDWSEQGVVAFTIRLLQIDHSYTNLKVIQPPSPKICGSPNGPPITAPRIRLKDGRYLAYKEYGVPRDEAKFKIIYVHGLNSGRHNTHVANLSPEVTEELGVYIVSFDRPGYGESDPNPKRTVKSMALDIEELADQLGLGSKFYVIGYSIGGQWIWSCLKYIPNRLAGATLLAPAVNYWWPRFPANVSNEAFNQKSPQDQWVNRVAHYTPWLFYWWNTQKWFPASSALSGKLNNLSSQDKEIMSEDSAVKKFKPQQVTQQGVFESLHRDFIVGQGAWGFDPLDLENPFPNNEGFVHLWHGDQDRIVPITMNRYIAQQHTWIHYHELSGAGHFFPLADGMPNAIIKALLIREK